MTEKNSILIVEDEMMIAMDLEISLQGLGWNVIGPVAHADMALQLVEKEKIDIGLLDYNLTSGTSEEIALALLKKSIPVIFLSGDTLRERSEGLKHCKIVQKPVNIDKLNEELQSALTHFISPVVGKADE